MVCRNYDQNGYRLRESQESGVKVSLEPLEGKVMTVNGAKGLMTGVLTPGQVFDGDMDKQRVMRQYIAKIGVYHSVMRARNELVKKYTHALSGNTKGIRAGELEYADNVVHECELELLAFERVMGLHPGCKSIFREALQGIIEDNEAEQKGGQDE